MREAMTTALDVLGLLLVAAGLAFWLWPTIGGGALAISGALLMIGSILSDRPIRIPRPRRTRAREARR